MLHPAAHKKQAAVLQKNLEGVPADAFVFWTKMESARLSKGDGGDQWIGAELRLIVGMIGDAVPAISI